MEIAFLAVTGMCGFFAWQWQKEKTKPVPKPVKLAHTPKPKQKRNLSDGAYAFLEHLNKIICNKNGRNTNRKIGLREVANESYDDKLYNISVLAIENNSPVKDSWYDIQAELSPDLTEFIEWIVAHINKGGSVGLISNQYEKRAIAINSFGTAIGEIIITENDFEYQDWSN